MSSTMEELKEYARKGVPNIWLIDPRLQTMFIYSAGDLHEVRAGAISTHDGRIQLTRAEVFHDLTR